MNNQTLFELMSEIDFDLIERAEAPVPMRKKPIFRVAMAAAVIAILLSVSTLTLTVAGVAVSVQAVQYVEQNYPAYDGTVLHFAQIFLTEDENAISSLLDDDTKRALGSLIEALRENWGGGELTEQSTPMPEEQTTEGGHETDETTQAETETEPEPEYTDKEPDEGWSEGLSYRQRVEDGRIVYVVSGRGDCTDTHVRIPPTYNGDAVVAIDESAFESDRTVVLLSVPSSVVEIGDNAFRHCENLQTVELTKGLGSIGQYAFDGTPALKEIEFPDSLGLIDEGAFWGTGLEQIFLPDSVTYVGEMAFSDCLNARAVKLSSGMTEIPARMFRQCVFLESVTLPSSVASIGENAFYLCINLRQIRYLGTPEDWERIKMPDEIREQLTPLVVYVEE